MKILRKLKDAYIWLDTHDPADHPIGMALVVIPSSLIGALVVVWIMR